MKQVEIRRAGYEDERALFPLVRAFATSFVPEAMAFHVSFRQILADDRTCLLLADAGSLVGYLLGFVHETFYANGPVGWVEELMVDEGRRRQGVGRQLIQSFEAWARERGCRLVALATRRARPFYLALGYEESETYLRRLL